MGEIANVSSHVGKALGFLEQSRVDNEVMADAQQRKEKDELVNHTIVGTAKNNTENAKRWFA